MNALRAILWTDYDNDADLVAMTEHWSAMLED
jgi:hypothetical protein